MNHTFLATIAAIAETLSEYGIYTLLDAQSRERRGQHAAGARCNSYRAELAGLRV